MPKIPEEKKEGISSKLKALGAEVQEQTEQALPHLMIKAYAGSGKTSTLVEGLRLLVEGSTKFNPSPQQEAVWAELLKSDGQAKTFCMTSFGTEIVKTLEERIPKHPSCVAKTLHSIGLKAINDSYGKRFEPDQYKSGKILASLKGMPYDRLLQNHQDLCDNVSELVSYCKLNALDHTVTDTKLRWVMDQYSLDFELNGDIAVGTTAVLQKSCKGGLESIDFDDMIWLPVVNNLILPTFDILFVDECQDLNVCQQKLALKLGRRLVLCGDPHQAIYAFAGADANSYNNLHEVLKSTSVGCIDLPLSVSFRCSQAVIREAKQWVPGIDPCSDNPEGKVSSGDMAWMEQWVMPGDLVICRNNAPLVSQCLKFLAAGKKAYIRGRKNIAKGLVRLVTKIAKQCRCGDNIRSFIDGVIVWKTQEIIKAEQETPPDERQMDYIRDRAACMEVLSRNVPTVKSLRDKIYAIFEDKTSEGIQLSTIHQAKGIEAKRVFFIRTKGNECPAPWAKTETQQQQERNLRYIGITRSIEELIYVN